MPLGKHSRGESVALLAMPVKRRRTTVRKTIKRRGAGRARRATRYAISRAPRGMSQGIAAIKKTYVDTTLINTGTGGQSGLTFTTDIKLSKVHNYAELAAVYQWYRINKVKIEIECPYNIFQEGVGGAGEGRMMYVMKEQLKTTATNPVPDSEQKWGEFAVKRRHNFGMGKSRRLTLYFTPHQWLDPDPSVSNTKIYKRWNECPVSAAGAVDYSGFIGMLMSQGTQTLSANETYKVYVTLYMQFKGIK